MERYREINAQFTDEGTRLHTTRYPYVEPTSEDSYVITVIGDRLDLLASQFYGSTEYWWVIAAANPNIRRDALFLAPGYQLRIPANLNKYLASYQNENR
jgi:nucleoid-associated protein YgaU